MLDLRTASESFLSWLKINNYSPTTIRMNLYFLGYFKVYLEKLGTTDLRGVTEQTITGYQKEIFGRNYSLATKQIILWRLKLFFKYLSQQQLILINPTGLIRLMGQERKLPFILSKQEMKKLLSVSYGIKKLKLRNKAILELLYSSGLRVSELTQLKVQDIDLKSGFVFIACGKGARDHVVPVGKQAVSCIQEYLVAIRPLLMGKENYPHLFLTERGTPLAPIMVRQLVRCTTRAVGIRKRVYPHLIRHTMATHLLNAGASLCIVQGILGHRGLDSTQRYTHLERAQLKKVWKKYHPRGKWSFDQQQPWKLEN